MTRAPLRPDVIAFLDWFARNAREPLSQTHPEEGRRRNRRLHERWEVATPPIRSISVGEVPGPAGAIPVRRFDDRPDAGPRPAIVYYHGGGFVVGDLETHAALCARIAAATGLPVISVDYRLAPENPWPAAPDDAEAAARAIADEPDTTGLILAGDSAGGTLAIVTALALRDRPAAVPVLAQWPIYPAVSPGTRFQSFDDYGEDHFLTRDDLAWFFGHYAANIRHWRATPIRLDQSGLPPTLVYVAQCDPLADQGRAYAEQCARAGVAVRLVEGEGAIHGILALRKAMPSGEEDLNRCLSQLMEMIAP